jgi:DNA polymerase-1
LQRFLNEYKPSHVACCFDAGSVTFRNELFPDYKANRGEPPEELKPQFDLCRELVERMGIPSLSLPGFEADDLMATLCERLVLAGYEVILVTGDKDLAQLVKKGVSVYDLAKEDWWDAGRIPEKLGVKAAQVTDLLGLMGDSVDNIPGVRGVGPKAACALLGHFKDLDAIYSRLDEVEKLPIRGAKSLRKKLEEQREQAYLSRQLATVKRDVEMELTIDSLRYRGAESELLDDFAQQWGLRRVAERVPRRE